MSHPFVGIPSFLRAPIVTELSKLDADILDMPLVPRTRSWSSCAPSATSQPGRRPATGPSHNPRRALDRLDP
jgi:hypothetical protein